MSDLRGGRDRDRCGTSKWCAFGVVACWALVCAPARAVTLTPILTSKQAAPQVDGSTVLNVRAHGYAIAGSNQLVFTAQLDPSASDAVYARYGTKIELAIPPDLDDKDPGACLSVGPLFVARDGSLATICNSNVPVAPFGNAVFFGQPGMVANAFPPDDTKPPGIPNTDMRLFAVENVYYREPGVLAFGASMNTPNVSSSVSSQGIWVVNDGKVSLVLLTGKPAPGFDGQFFVSSPLPTVMSLTARGKALLRARETSGTIAAWSGTADSNLKLELADGDPAPGLDGETFRIQASGFGYYMTDDDDLIVLATTSSGRRGLWTGPSHSLELVKTPSGGRLRPDLNTFAYTPKGRVAFVGYDESVQADNGLWTGPASAPRLIARLGEPLRGAPDLSFASVSSIELNERGQMMVTGVLGTPRMPTEEAILRYAPATGFERIPTDAVIQDQGVRHAIQGYTDACASPAGNGPVLPARCLDEDGRFALAVVYADGTSGLVLTDAMQPGGADVPIDHGATDLDGGTDTDAAVGSGGGGGASSAGGKSNVGAGGADNGPTEGTGGRARGVDGSAPPSGSSDVDGGEHGKSGGPSASSREASGCGCSFVESRPGSLTWWGAGAAAFATLLRRRRHLSASGPVPR
jgi:MYXO-CTERM domain-containing protein